MVKKFYDTDYLRDLKELIERSAHKYGTNIAMKDLDTEGNIHQYTYIELKEDIEALGTKLLDLGLQGRHFALIGESSYSYVVSYLAVANGLGVIVPLDKELPNDDLLKLIIKSDADVLFYSDSLKSDIDEIKAASPQELFCINISMYENFEEGPNIKRFLKEGMELINQGDRRYMEIIIDPLAMCGILFTSGTTGANKGVMLCHQNLATVLHSAFSLFKLGKVSFSVLPINHTYEFNVHVLGTIYGGITLCFNDSIMHVKENLLKFKPEMSLMVPMIVESLYKNIWNEAKKTRLDKHLRYGIWYSNLIRKIGIDERKIFFKPVLEALGGNLRLIVSGGAPLRQEIIKGFDDLGITVYNGYGITECAPLISSNCTLKSVPGSVGIIVPDIKVRISDKNPDGTGEIQVSGPNVMLGYYKDEECTKKTFTEDGWFKTGDIGYIGKKGALYITGREKNLIILTNGKNVHPEELEEYLVANLDYVKEVVVYALESLEGVEALISASAFLDPEYLERVGLEKAKETFTQDVRRLNSNLATYKRIQCAYVRETEFEKTTTKKIKRFAIDKGGE